MQKIIDIHNAVTRHPSYRMKSPVNMTVEAGQQICIAGNNGAGKTMLVDIITGAHPILDNGRDDSYIKYDFTPSASAMASDNIKYITFRDSYGSNDNHYYYQMRFNQTEFDSMPVVGDILRHGFDSDFGRKLFSMFHLDALMDKKLVLLSSGEMRKFQLTKVLLTHPRVLILDNPFIGLDVEARGQLESLLTSLVHETDLQVILVQSKVDGIPGFITHVIPVENMEVKPKMTLQEYKAQLPDIPAGLLPPEKVEAIRNLPYSDSSEPDLLPGTQHVVDFRDVSIRYGERTILKDLNLTVMNGEKWALSGENGAGKSTLLSLVCADNPQAYANRIILFDYKRGSGESIWDIKKYIGYISPEMHRAYQKDYPAIEIVASGLHDSVGLYKKPRPEQMGICEFWMDIFSVRQYKDVSFLKLSSGEQRLVLLARAFVKDPSLLILDEPLHGLDLVNRRLVKDVIEEFCKRKNKTLIMVTHYQEELPPCIEKSIYLKKQK